MSLSKEEISRYSRHIQLKEVGINGQEKLKQATVLVIGAGGLGCPVLQYLTAAGLGTIGIVDYDIVEENNLQRQVLFNNSLVGKNKAIAAKEQLEKLNPHIQLNAYPEKLDDSNAISLFERYDVIVDATDNFDTRYLINDAALLSHKPYVFAAIHRFEGQVSVFNYKGGPTYRCLFPANPTNTTIPNCEEAGVLGVLAGIVGAYQANEVLKIILGLGDTLSGQLMLINTLNHSTSLIKIKRNEKEIEKVFNQKVLNPIPDFQEVTPTQLKKRINQGESFNFLDVREENEQPKIEEIRGQNIPLSKLELSKNKVLNNKNLIIYCQTGLRSKKAIALLNQKGNKKLYSLKGGIKAWMQVEETKSNEII